LGWNCGAVRLLHQVTVRDCAAPVRHATRSLSTGDPQTAGGLATATRTAGNEYPDTAPDGTEAAMPPISATLNPPPADIGGSRASSQTK